MRQGANPSSRTPASAQRPRRSCRCTRSESARYKDAVRLQRTDCSEPRAAAAAARPRAGGCARRWPPAPPFQRATSVVNVERTRDGFERGVGGGEGRQFTGAVRAAFGCEAQRACTRHATPCARATASARHRRAARNAARWHPSADLGRHRHGDRIGISERIGQRAEIAGRAFARRGHRRRGPRATRAAASPRASATAKDRRRCAAADATRGRARRRRAGTG